MQNADPPHQTTSPTGTYYPPWHTEVYNDTWNGYHSLEPREEDHHFTTFIMPYCRYRYKVGPQGWLATSNTYTQRYEKITVNADQVK